MSYFALNHSLGMEETDSSSGSERHVPSSSSSHAMSGDEQRILKKIRERLKHIAGVQVRSVSKPSVTETIIHLSFGDQVDIQVVHAIGSLGDSRFTAEGNEDARWLIFAINDRSFKSVNELVVWAAEAVQHHRLASLMATLRVDPDSETDLSRTDEEVISSGTTAASPQSSRSTTTSNPLDI